MKRILKQKTTRKRQLRNTKGKLKTGPVTTTTTTGVAAPPPQVTPTTPFSLFQCCIARARNLLAICDHLPTGIAPQFKDDACRAAIVLAISALDAFLRTFVLTKIVNKVADPSQSIPVTLKAKLEECVGYDVVLDAARQGDLKAKVETAFRAHFEDQSFQGVKKIADSMKLIGHDGVFDSIARAAGINEENLKRDIGRHTKRRHIIAHCGDHDLTQNPPLQNTVTNTEAKNCIDLVELIAIEINKLG